MLACGHGRTTGPRSLPAGDPAHVGEMMGDALVAVDAGLLAREQEALMRDRGARRLLCDVHRLRGVAVAALEGIIGLEPRPFVQRELLPFVQEFLAGVDIAEQLAPDLLRGLHLACD